MDWSFGMTPCIGAAQSDPGALGRLESTEIPSNASQRVLIAFAFVTMIATLSGCCCYNDCVDVALKRTEARLAFDEACNPHVAKDLEVDYKRGWRAGYVDVSEGRSGAPPAVPPHRYRTYPYQTGSGKHATVAWYQGFAAGAAAAKCQGLDLANRVYSVETPRCICQGPCHCGASAQPGILPSSEAMLRRQAMRRTQVVDQGPVYQGQIIEERIIEDRPMIPIPAPAPTETPVQQGDGSASTPQPYESPRADNDQATSDAGGLVQREIAPPHAVRLPSNAHQLEDNLRVPSVQQTAPAIVESEPMPSRLVVKPGVVSVEPPQALPAAVTPATPEPTQLSVPSIVASRGPSLPTPLPPEVPSTPPASPPQVAKAPIVAPAPVSDPYRFQPFVDRAREFSQPQAATPQFPEMPQPETRVAIDQPGSILMHSRRSQGAHTANAPAPRALVRETPRPVPAPLPAVSKRAVQPPMPLPPLAMSEPMSTPPVRGVRGPVDEINIPDVIGFPAGLKPSSPSAPSSAERVTTRPQPPTPVAMVRIPPEASKAPPLAKLPPFVTSSRPSNDASIPSTLMQPPGVRGNSGVAPQPVHSPTTQPHEPNEQPRVLPQKLVHVADDLEMPQRITPFVSEPEPFTFEHFLLPSMSCDLTQPTNLQIPSQSPVEYLEPDSDAGELCYPGDLTFSLMRPPLERAAVHAPVVEPTGVETQRPSNELFDIQFPRLVWPTAYEVEVPPVEQRQD